MITEEKINSEIILEVAKRILVAARSAPKARGVDNLFLAIIKGAKIKKLSLKMKQIGKKYDMPFFIRDSKSILHCPCLIIIGTKISAIGLKKCGFCGFGSCSDKNKYPHIPCAFNTGDLGIALGSAVSIAADNRIDNRIMFTAGYAAIKMGLVPKNVKIAYGIPLAAESKNPFFDRD